MIKIGGIRNQIVDGLSKFSLDLCSIVCNYATDVPFELDGEVYVFLSTCYFVYDKSFQKNNLILMNQINCKNHSFYDGRSEKNTPHY